MFKRKEIKKKRDAAVKRFIQSVCNNERLKVSSKTGKIAFEVLVPKMWRVVDNLDDDEECRQYINQFSTVKGCGISDPIRDNFIDIPRKVYRVQKGSSEYKICDIRLNWKLAPLGLKIYDTLNCSAIVKVYGGMEVVETNGSSTTNWYLLYKKNGDVSNNSELTLVNPDMNCTKMIHALRIHYDCRKIKETSLNVFVTCFGLNPVQLKIKMLNDKILTTKSGNEEKFDYFSILPNEMIAKIFGYFDLKTLARTAQVCSRFNDIVTKTDHFYYNLDFKSYRMWDYVLDKFMDKTKNLKKLNLGWQNEIRGSKVVEFLNGAKNSLTHFHMFRLCTILDMRVIKAIFACRELLELHFCAMSLGWPSDNDGWFNADFIQCKNLRKLNLYGTSITDSQLIKIISKTRKLKHLLLDNITLGPLDNILEKLVEFEINLETWSSRYGTFSSGSLSLFQFHTNLEELDLSNCSFYSDLAPTFTLNFLAKCSRLKRLSLAGWKSIKDEHLVTVIENCKKLEQLNILESKFISATSIEGFLKLENLKMLDITESDLVSLSQIEKWQKEYPKVLIRTPRNELY